jgi:ribosome maturation factor RimP
VAEGRNRVEELRADIEKRIEGLNPQVELIALEKAGPETLRLYIDHPDGVDLDLCEQVSRGLVGLTADWALEVSSPGLDRPLTKPSHYRRFLGSRVRVRTREAVEGRKNFTGRLEAADERSVSVSDEQGLHEIPLDAVHRSNLVPELSEVSK